MADSDAPLSPRGTADIAAGRLRRGSVQLMHDINVQAFPYPHNNNTSLPSTPVRVSSSVPAAAPRSLLSTLLSSSYHDATTENKQHHHSDVTMSPTSANTEMAERRAARDLLHFSNMRHTRSIVDPRGGGTTTAPPPLGDGDEFVDDDTMTRQEWLALQDAARVSSQEEKAPLLSSNNGSSSRDSYGNATQPPLLPEINHTSGNKRVDNRGSSFSIAMSLKQSQNTVTSRSRKDGFLANAFQQSSAVAVIALLNMMISIPFGASYFPIGWSATDGGDRVGEVEDEDGVSGSFPLPGKQALGAYGLY